MGRPGEDKFTDSIKQKLENYEPTFKQEAWVRMSNKLSTAPTPRPWLKPWLLGIGTGVIIMLTFYFSTRKTEDTIELTIHDTALIAEINELKREIKALQRSQNHNANYNSEQYSEANITTKSKESKPIIKQQYIFIEKPIRTNNDYPPTQVRELSSILSKEAEITGIAPLIVDSLPKTNSGISLVDSDLKKKKKKTKCKINWPEFNLKSPHESYGQFTGPDKIFANTSFGNENYIDSIKMFGKTFGIGVSGRLNHKLNLSGAINYGLSDGNATFEFSSLKQVQQDDSIVTVLSPDSTLTQTIKWQYLDVPLQLDYRVLSYKKHSVDLSLGTVSRFYLSEHYSNIWDFPIKEDKSTNTKIGAFEHIHPLAKINFGVSYAYHLTERWNLQVQPYYSISTQKQSMLKVKSNSLGLNFRAVYQFNMHNRSRNNTPK